MHGFRDGKPVLHVILNFLRRRLLCRNLNQVNTASEKLKDTPLP